MHDYLPTEPIADIIHEGVSEDSAIANLQRAEAGRLAALAFPWNDNDPITNLSDLIADLLHLADVIDPGAGYGVLKNAETHYIEECAEALDDEPVAA